MWPIILRSALGKFGKYVTLPFVAIIGFVGYNVEGWMSDRYTPAPTASITQQRQERLLENIDTSATKKKHSPLEVNLSPSLSS